MTDIVFVNLISRRPFSEKYNFEEKNLGLQKKVILKFELQQNAQNTSKVMPTCIKIYVSEPTLNPEDYWICSFCELLYLTQGIVADKEVKFNAERTDPRNATKILTKMK